MAGMSEKIRLFLCGDVMLARGIDMIQHISCDPTIYEGNNLDAYGYVHIAEMANGPIPAKSERGPAYVWGYALEVLKNKKPDARIINLETSITTHDKPWPRKGINYRMHPNNVSILKQARIDCCALANNHTADWGYESLRDTLSTLESASISYAGAGLNLKRAQAPAVIELTNKNARILVFSAGHFSSGVPREWKATSHREGVNILDIHTPSKAVSELKDLVKKYKTSHDKQGSVRDIVILSIHWGGNWGFPLEPHQQELARLAIDKADVDIVHGHSSHHVKGIEIYKNKPILYGCGDFINDYEGIGGHEEYRGDLSLMYFIDLELSGKHIHLDGVNMVPTKMRQLRVNRAEGGDVDWLHETMERECQQFGVKVARSGDEFNLVID